MPMPTDHVARISLSEEAYVRIEAAIMDGTLEPGERLRDSDLVEWLGISRTPIRHALDRLAEQGLIEMERNRYTRVSEFDITGVLESVHVAADLWSGAALHGIPAWDEEDDELTGDIQTELVAAATEDDTVRFITVFEHLVVAFARIEGNDVRIRTLGNVLPQVRRLGRKLHGRLDPLVVSRFTRDLREATLRRDGRAAVLVIDGYVSRIGEVLASL
ncbi:GntR family transcriptional regulator [Leifsonia shinshuensis]|uniref:DNA-binding GntR family transcriptional regulator n=1 Tax=Leifsonia shinshuensis TaxID=150026 RepID=A0A853CTS6_9MICO|nr:GntR family transcriptional regulator [Leifsonia shinshuensis]NYJ22005.1 DNA-binding GntR family transcriptional regulator [Leifsonia shinshuensis]